MRGTFAVQILNYYKHKQNRRTRTRKKETPQAQNTNNSSLVFWYIKQKTEKTQINYHKKTNVSLCQKFPNPKSMEEKIKSERFWI